jgi:hypothetical protein
MVGEGELLKRISSFENERFTHIDIDVDAFAFTFTFTFTVLLLSLLPLRFLDTDTVPFMVFYAFRRDCIFFGGSTRGELELDAGAGTGAGILDLVG